MGQHKTPESIAVISAISRLGAALDYRVDPEWNIPGTEPNAEQIDLAFFISASAKMPVLAIEVDSADVPASMSNPMKIFGKPARTLVKPTFVFHVFLRVAGEDRRRMNAEGAFSTHNYRTYNFEKERNEFLADLIEVHCTIKSELDIVDFAIALDDDVWNSTDRYEVLDKAAKAGEITLGDIAQIVANTTHMKEYLARTARSSSLANIRVRDVSFAGRMFSWPLLLGLRAFLIPEDAKDLFEELREWQEGLELIFSPDTNCLGLSQEFDVAIVELAPPIFYLVAILFSGHKPAASTLCEQLLKRAIDGKLGGIWARYALLWCALAGLRVGADNVAQRAVDEINRLGGLPSSVLVKVPQAMQIDDSSEDWESVITSQSAEALTLDNLKSKLQLHAPLTLPVDALIARLLVDDTILSSLNDLLVTLRGKY
jgi:hypothetical protein